MSIWVSKFCQDLTNLAPSSRVDLTPNFNYYILNHQLVPFPLYLSENSFIKVVYLGQNTITPKMVDLLEFSFLLYPPDLNGKLFSRCHLGSSDLPYTDWWFKKNIFMVSKIQLHVHVCVIHVSGQYRMGIFQYSIQAYSGPKFWGLRN